MLCDPKKLTDRALDAAVQIIREAAQPFLSFEAVNILYNGQLGDIMDEEDSRVEVDF